MLFVGRSGTGISNLGMEIAKMLLCDAENDDVPCTICKSCHLVSQGIHPDLHVIATEEAEDNGSLEFMNHSIRYNDSSTTKRERKAILKNTITVEQIRTVTDSLNKSPGIGSKKSA